MKVRLTKSRLERLNAALSLDDVLYEKFRRLNQELKREFERLAKADRVVAVYQKKGNIRVALQVEEIHRSPDGTVVIVC